MTEPREGTKIVCPHCKETLEIVGMVPEADRDQLREALKFYAMKKYDNGERARIALSSEDSTP